MSQHYLKYHFKSPIICTNAVSEDESNGNNTKDIEIDVLNGNSNGRRLNTASPLSFIRITENPLN